MTVRIGPRDTRIHARYRSIKSAGNEIIDGNEPGSGAANTTPDPALTYIPFESAEGKPAVSHISDSERDPSRIRAIETHYAGHRFRSRLEARWAVFFDTLGIEWEYEAQGYESEAGRYLPDFWLPELRIWVEVKGELSHRDLVKVGGAVFDLRAPVDSQIMPQLVLLGPMPRPGYAWTHSLLSILGDRLLWNNAYFSQEPGFWCVRPVGTTLVFPKGAFARGDEELTASFRDDVVKSMDSLRLTVDPDVNNAYRAARSARFEFGESGA